MILAAARHAGVPPALAIEALAWRTLLVLGAQSEQAEDRLLDRGVGNAYRPAAQLVPVVHGVVV